MSNIITVRGVYVGGKDLMRDMVRAIEANDIHPVVDKKVFSLDHAQDAYRYMVSGFRSNGLKSYIDTTEILVGPEALWQGDNPDRLRMVVKSFTHKSFDLYFNVT